MKYKYLLAYKRDMKVSETSSMTGVPQSEIKIIDYKLDSEKNLSTLSEELECDMTSFSFIEEVEDREKIICECGNDKWVSVRAYSNNNGTHIVYQCSTCQKEKTIYPEGNYFEPNEPETLYKNKDTN